MPTVEVYNIAGKKLREIELSDKIFACEVKPYLMHDVVVWQMANHRTSTAKTKTRAEVSGGGAKPWKQKGTGRARAGSNRSPLWRGGGVIFGPNERSYTKDLPKKVRKAALRSVLSMKLNDQMLKVVDKVALKDTKTKLFIKALDSLGMGDALIVMGNVDMAAALASRNAKEGKVLDVRGLNVSDMLKYKGLILDLDAIAWIEEVLS